MAEPGAAVIEIALKAFHIAGLAIWAGGLVALPGLLGVSATGPDGEIDDESARQLNVARLAYEFVVSPAAVLTIATGTALIFIASYETGWLGLKLGAVGAMALLHMVVGRGLDHGGRHFVPGRFLRLALTGAIAASIAGVLAVVLGKPTLDEGWFPDWLTQGRPDGFLSWLTDWLGAIFGSGLAGDGAWGVHLLVLIGHAEPVLKDEFAAVPAGKADEDDLQARQQQPEGQHRLLGPAEAVHPVEGQHREQRHGDHRVAPGRGVEPGARHQQHLAGTAEGGETPHGEGRARAPKRCSREEGIERPPIERVATRDPEGAGDREGDQHRVDRMAEDRDPAVEIVEPVSFARRGDDIRSIEAHGGPFPVPITRPVAAIALGLALAGCAGPLSTLDPAGPAAERVATLWWVMLAGASVILVGVMALALWPFRKGGVEGEVARTDAADRRYLWLGGLALPLTVLAALLAYAFALEWRAHGLTGDTLRVEATAQRWMWTFAYPDAPGGLVQTGDRLHIPAGRPIEVSLVSRDVIHSFWVPRLAGKRDVIPGRVNRLTILADRPGVYGGVCSEFCGEGHAGMAFTVEAHPPEALEAALAEAAGTTGSARP